ncbi:MAG: hypothetical protein FWC80_03355 [Firmicutes bacterium]|nr:hypothetical protein [Bacillota bacterium]
MKKTKLFLITTILLVIAIPLVACNGNGGSNGIRVLDGTFEHRVGAGTHTYTFERNNTFSYTEGSTNRETTGTWENRGDNRFVLFFSSGMVRIIVIHNGNLLLRQLGMNVDDAVIRNELEVTPRGTTLSPVEV